MRTAAGMGLSGNSLTAVVAERGESVCACASTLNNEEIRIARGMHLEMRKSVTHLAQQTPMLLQDAAVHHHDNARSAGLFGGGFVDDALLHPDCRHFQFNGFIHNGRHKLGAAEDVYDIDLLRNG